MERKVMAKEEFTDAIAMLKADHEKVKGLFEKFETARSNKMKILTEICNELKVHTMLEEEIFYPAMYDALDDDDILDEAQVEHDGAKVLINDLMSGGADGDDYFEAKVTVLQEEILHHIKEEESEMFKEARKSDADLKELRDRMLARKEELMAQLKAEGLPAAEIKSIRIAA
jgi:iron-sulfur cluster repair protein YtfE (RIC family)